MCLLSSDIVIPGINTEYEIDRQLLTLVQGLILYLYTMGHTCGLVPCTPLFSSETELPEQSVRPLSKSERNQNWIAAATVFALSTVTSHLIIALSSQNALQITRPRVSKAHLHEHAFVFGGLINDSDYMKFQTVM